MRKQPQSAPTVLPRQSQPNPYSPVLDYHVCSTHHLRIMEIRQDWTHTHTQHTHNTQNTRTQTQNSSDIFLLSWKEWLHQSFHQISRREEDFFWSGLSGNNTATLWCRFCFVWCSGTRCHSDRDTYFSVNVTRRPMISCVHAFEWLERVDEWEEKRKKIFWMYIKRAPEDKRVCVCVWVCVCVCECFSVRVRVLMVLNGPM